MRNNHRTGRPEITKPDLETCYQMRALCIQIEERFDEINPVLVALASGQIRPPLEVLIERLKEEKKKPAGGLAK